VRLKVSPRFLIRLILFNTRTIVLRPRILPDTGYLSADFQPLLFCVDFEAIPAMFIDSFLYK
jgi:hypothetical protein